MTRLTRCFPAALRFRDLKLRWNSHPRRQRGTSSHPDPPRQQGTSFDPNPPRQQGTSSHPNPRRQRATSYHRRYLLTLQTKTFPAFQAAVLLGILLLAGGTATAGTAEANFHRDIRPLLSKHCFACHGPDDGARQADLRLDTAAGILAERDSTAAVVPGNPNTSPLIQRVESSDPDLLMPPPDSGHQLTAEEKQQLRNWVASGADYQLHWAFVPPQQPQPPAVSRSDWPQNPLDTFVLQRLEAAGLNPAPPADRYQLLRRLSLDLTGLPPTPEAADAFAADTSPQAYQTVVDRLLQSEAYGERWARMWLDLARYADTKGYEKDLPREMWRYRDWVIQAFNQDLPFDRFTIEQLAGDLLPEPTDQQVLATAFHRNTMTNDEGGTDNEEFRVAAVKDRVDTTLQVWMGLTAGCAKCHSHKYDPVTQHDYYSFYAFFNQTQDADRPDDAPVLSLPTATQAAEIAKLEAALQQLKDAPAKSSPAADADQLQQQREAVQQQLAELRKAAPKTPVMRELPADKQRTTHLHNRGNFLDPGDAVAPAVPEQFGPWPDSAENNRLGVARWLIQPENPLAARVMVNRVWARLFGTGLVETEEDFGSQGAVPTHPELLDWLAIEFQQNGWSVKQLIRTIVSSATYQQSSVVSAEKLAADPRNLLLSRGARFRLSAEAVRDQALAVSGLLNRQVGGPSVMPPQPDGIWRSTYNAAKWEDAEGPDRYRRALYTYWKRTSPYPAMLAFDAGSGEVCQIRRVRTNTPLQALVTLNDPAFIEAAAALAIRMAEDAQPLRQQVERGFRLALIRPPEPAETDRLIQLYHELQAEFAADPEAAAKLTRAARRPAADAALTTVANVLLNLDETLMRP